MLDSSHVCKHNDHTPTLQVHKKIKNNDEEWVDIDNNDYENLGFARKKVKLR
jgi:hypothetical protein